MRLVTTLSLALALASCGSTPTLPVEAPPTEHWTDSRRIDLPLFAADTVHLNGFLGALVVDVAVDRAPWAKLSLSTAADSEDEARARLAAVHLNCERVGSALSLGVDGATSGIALQLELGLPPGSAFTSTAGTGPVEVNGPLRALLVQEHRGTIRARDVSERVFIRSLLGEVLVDEVFGDCEVEAAAGDIELQRITGRRVIARSRGGDVRLRAIHVETVEAYSTRGTLELIDVEAGLTARAEDGPLTLTASRGPLLFLTTDRGDIRLDQVHGDLRIETRIGTIEASRLEGSVDAQTKQGSISLEGVFQDLRAHNLTGEIEVNALDKSVAERAWRLESRFSGVTLRLPEQFDCRLELGSERGQVRQELGVDLETIHVVGNDRLHGALGSGGNSVSVISGEGDVSILRAEP